MKKIIYYNTLEERDNIIKEKEKEKVGKVLIEDTILKDCNFLTFIDKIDKIDYIDIKDLIKILLKKKIISESDL